MTLSPKSPLTRVALVDQVTAVLQERILDGVYAPEQKLNIDGLSREFEVSSSPIREALARLAATGLAVSEAFSGFSVAPEPSHAWFEQLCDYRVLSEGWAARQLAANPDAVAVRRMQDSLRVMEETNPRGTGSEYVAICRADEAFHNAILEACRNEVLAQSVKNLHPHLHHARLFARLPHDIRPVLGEHKAILAAILDKDEAGAEAAIAAHLRSSWQRYLDADRG